MFSEICCLDENYSSFRYFLESELSRIQLEVETVKLNNSRQNLEREPILIGVYLREPNASEISAEVPMIQKILLKQYDNFSLIPWS